MSKRILFLLAASYLALSGHVQGAEEVRNNTNYQIALSGLPLANAFFQTRKTGEAYAIDAQVASTGIGNIIVDTKAELSSSGAVKGGRFRPEKFSFRYKSGKRVRSFETRFTDDNVVSAVIEPKPKKHRRGWIDVKPEDLRAVTDPIAGLMVPAGNQPCRAEIKVFDGETRLSLKLTQKREQPFKTEGFNGSAIVCSVRYEPKSGYRVGKNDVDYVSKLPNMEIWFAKSASMDIYAPVFLSVPTKYGTLTITATHFDG